MWCVTRPPRGQDAGTGRGRGCRPEDSIPEEDGWSQPDAHRVSTGMTGVLRPQAGLACCDRAAGPSCPRPRPGARILWSGQHRAHVTDTGCLCHRTARPHSVQPPAELRRAGRGHPQARSAWPGTGDAARPDRRAPGGSPWSTPLGSCPVSRPSVCSHQSEPVPCDYYIFQVSLSESMLFCRGCSNVLNCVPKR